MIRRRVYIVCDGPCGKVYEGTSLPGEGWAKLSIAPWEKLAPKQKPTGNLSAWLCNNCLGPVLSFLAKGHYVLRGQQEE